MISLGRSFHWVMSTLESRPSRILKAGPCLPCSHGGRSGWKGDWAAKAETCFSAMASPGFSSGSFSGGWCADLEFLC